MAVFGVGARGTPRRPRSGRRAGTARCRANRRARRRSRSRGARRSPRRRCRPRRRTTPCRAAPASSAPASRPAGTGKKTLREGDRRQRLGRGRASRRGPGSNRRGVGASDSMTKGAEPVGPRPLSTTRRQRREGATAHAIPPVAGLTALHDRHDTGCRVAPVAELVDALDSKSSSARSAGSIPARGTTAHPIQRHSAAVPVDGVRGPATLFTGQSTPSVIQRRTTLLV